MNEAAPPTERWEGRPAGYWQDRWGVPGVRVFSAIGSTNDEAIRWAEAGCAEGSTVVADRQTAGRGRAGRTWEDAPGLSLLASVVFRGAPGADPSVMPLRIGLAVARAVERNTGLFCRIKWPNDLVLTDGTKLGGVLCEAATGAGALRLVAGIGLNVGHTPDDFPAPLRPTATSLAIAGVEAERALLLGAILSELRPFRVQPPPLEPDCLLALDRRDSLRGLPVAVDGVLAGTAAGFSPDGGLRVRSPAGLRTIYSGTVRPAGPESLARPVPTARHGAAGPQPEP